MKYRVFIALGALALASCTPQPQTMPVTSDDEAAGPASLNVADAAIAGGDPSMALSVSQSVLTTEPNNVDALIHEGDAYYALGRCPAAQAAYALALQNNAKSSAAETGLGRCLIKSDPAQAEQALLLAIQDDPGNADALNDLGIARDLQGNFAGAIDPYQKALLAQPGMTAAEINLGLSLALSGNGQQALEYLGPMAAGQGATPKIREDYAAALVATGRISEARQVLSIDLAPDQVDAALAGFNAIIAQAQTPLPVGTNTTEGPTAAAAPMQEVQTASAAPPPPMTPQAAPPPDITTPPADNATQNPNAAYTGPSPVPGAISSSTSGPGAPPPATAPAPAAAPAETASDTDDSGSYKVQLGALPSQTDAQAQWDKMSGAMPALFSGKSPDIENASVNGKTFYRLRTGSFSTRSDAAKFCGEVSAAGNACTLANF